MLFPKAEALFVLIGSPSILYVEVFEELLISIFDDLEMV